MAKQKRNTAKPNPRTTPARPEVPDPRDAWAAEQPHNANKSLEYGVDDALAPTAGVHHEPPSLSLTASTQSESNYNDKTGKTIDHGTAPEVGPLRAVRVDSTGTVLTTNQGVPIGDNQSSLKAGLRGPTLLEDFILREKITHFDHERIPERIVHARGSGAHGYFESYGSFKKLTRASLLSEAGKRTPVFVRFSTVAGERGSVDTARDVRGFAVKFYTDEGNWDLVGNNMPVFFIQDAMKFPDLVHAVKPEPHHGMPQAASAHDTFWDFISLMPESTHMMMWAMSDRAIPRSYRTMQGFGVHTFRLVNANGDSVLCKFHWNPKQGTHSLVWDEAVRISGADPDFHRRDLWEAIESGEYPEWELGVQIFTEEEADKFSFDVLDATKIVPEDLVPIKPLGRMVLDRNPDNFFAETEQVAFCAAHIVPGLDFSNDPLLAGRIHSYMDTQISRLGGANFHEIPVNAPLAPVHNNQRDGMHRQAVHRGRVAYEPNSLGGGCPHQAGMKGFVSVARNAQVDRSAPDKLRGKPEKFAEHYAQARLFFDSQSDVEKRHIIAAFRFELSKVTVPAIRVRMISSLLNVSRSLAAEVAKGVGVELPDPMPKAAQRNAKPEIQISASLSLLARPGQTGCRTRKVAILATDGVDGKALDQLLRKVADEGAVPVLIGPSLAALKVSEGYTVHPDATLENSPSVLFDGVAVPGGAGIVALQRDRKAVEFVELQYRHCKPLLAYGEGKKLLEAANAHLSLPDGTPDPGIFVAGQTGADPLKGFLAALGSHRVASRDAAVQ